MRPTAPIFGVAALAVAAGWWSCRSVETPPPDPAAAACARVAAQAFPAVANAGAKRNDSNATAMLPGTFYRIALQPSPTQPGRYLGFVPLAIDSAGTYRLFLDAAYPLALLDSAGNPLRASVSEQDSGVCAAIDVFYTFALAAGSYQVQVGTTDSTHAGFLAEAVP